MAPKKRNIAQKARSDVSAGPPLRTPNPETLSWMACFLSCFKASQLLLLSFPARSLGSFHKMRAKKIRSALWQAPSFATSTGCGKFFQKLSFKQPQRSQALWALRVAFAASSPVAIEVDVEMQAQGPRWSTGSPSKSYHSGGT